MSDERPSRGGENVTDERVERIRKTWRPETMVPVPPDETPDRLDIAREDIAYLLARLDRAREWKESILGLLRTYPEFELWPWGGDKTGWGFCFEFIKRMVREATILQAQVAQMRGDVERYVSGLLQELAEVHSGPGTLRRKRFEERPFIIGARQFLVVLSSSSAPQRWEAAMRVIGAASKVLLLQEELGWSDSEAPEFVALRGALTECQAVLGTDEGVKADADG